MSRWDRVIPISAGHPPRHRHPLKNTRDSFQRFEVRRLARRWEGEGGGDLCGPEVRRGDELSDQFFFILAVSYLRLLEYHRSSGMPMEGRVITPKAAQSK